MRFLFVTFFECWYLNYLSLPISLNVLCCSLSSSLSILCSTMRFTCLPLLTIILGELKSILSSVSFNAELCRCFFELISLARGFFSMIIVALVEELCSWQLPFRVFSETICISLLFLSSSHHSIYLWPPFPKTMPICEQIID